MPKLTNPRRSQRLSVKNRKIENTSQSEYTTSTTSYSSDDTTSYTDSSYDSNSESDYNSSETSSLSSLNLTNPKRIEKILSRYGNLLSKYGNLNNENLLRIIIYNEIKYCGCDDCFNKRRLDKYLEENSTTKSTTETEQENDNLSFYSDCSCDTCLEKQKNNSDDKEQTTDKDIVSDNDVLKNKHDPYKTIYVPRISILNSNNDEECMNWIKSIFHGIWPIPINNSNIDSCIENKIHHQLLFTCNVRIGKRYNVETIKQMIEDKEIYILSLSINKCTEFFFNLQNLLDSCETDIFFLFTSLNDKME